jgi:hypothetical protein
MTAADREQAFFDYEQWLGDRADAIVSGAPMSPGETAAFAKIVAMLPPPQPDDVRRERNRFIVQYLVTCCAELPTKKEKFRKLIADLKNYQTGDWRYDQHLVAPRCADKRRHLMFEIMKRGPIMSVSRLYDIFDDESDGSHSI